jgi:hypothetical protein
VPGYSAGTVFLEVVPSFHNVQRSVQRQAQDVGRAYEREVGGSLDRVDKRVDKSAKRTGGAFVRELQKSLGRSARAINVKVNADSSEAEKDVRKAYLRMKAFSRLRIGVDVDGAEAVAEATALKAALKRIVDDDDLDIRLRVDAGTARQELARFQEAVARATGLTRQELADQRAADRERAAAARQRARDDRAAANERIRIQREVARNTADTERQMADQARFFRQQQTAEQRKALAEYGRILREKTAMAQKARAEEREAVDIARRPGASDDDVERGRASIIARYRAEAEAANAAARQRAFAAALASGAEIRAAHRAADEVVDSQEAGARAAALAAAQRMALARLASAVEQNAARASRREQRNILREAWVANIGQAANSFRLFNGALLTAVTIGPLLIPILAGIAGGLGAIAVMSTAALAGVGILVAGFGGIGKALQAMTQLGKERRSATANAGKNQASDLRQLRDAQLALSRAREDSGQRIAAAAERQARAEKTLTKAVQDAVDAQLDLVRARREAAEQLEDMNARLTSGLLEEQLGAFQLQEAGFRFNNVLEDDQASDREKAIARIEYEQAKQQYADLQRSNRRLEKEVAEANAKGVEGSDQVVAAQEAVQNSTEGIADAEKELAQARTEYARAQVEEARTMADAQQRVADAMLDLQNKSVEAGVAGSAAMDNLREAMLNLSPAGQAFAGFLFGLKPLLDDIRFAAQEGLLPGVQSLIQGLVDTYGPDFVRFVGSLAGVMGELFRAAGKALTAPFWQDFFRLVERYAPILIGQFAQIIGGLATMFAGIITAFAPYAQELGDFFVQAALGLAEWGKNLAASEGFGKFIDYLRESGPKVGELLGLIVEALVKLGIGLAPYADKLLDLLIGFARFLTEQDPDTLARWALGLMAVVGAIQVMAGLLATVSSVVGLFAGLAAIAGSGGAAAGAGATAAVASGPIGWIILAAAAAVAAIVGLIWWINHLIETNDLFRERVSIIFGNVGEIFGRFAEVFGTVFGPINAFFRDILGPTISWLWTDIIQPVFGFIGGIFNVIGQVISTVANMIWQIFAFVLAPLFLNWYDQHIKPVWENNIKPLFDAVGRFISENIAPAWQAGLDAIGRIWNQLIEIAKAPVRFVVETVINRGIIDTFNTLVDNFPGMTKVDHVRLPSGWDAPAGGGARGGIAGRFAAGGVLPGYTPGRDVHHFSSATAGSLDLSGGEAIMVPEWTRAVGGPAAVAEMNRRARRGYADGGVLGWLGRAGSAVTDAITGAAGAISDLLSNPGKVLRRVVEALTGGSTGFPGVVASMPVKAVDGIAQFVQGFFGRSGAPRGAAPGGSPLGWQAMTTILQSAFPGARVSSAYRPGAITAVGTPSYHGSGRAIDIVPPSMAIFEWLSANYPNSAELLYTPAGARQILGHGRRGNTSGVTAAMHYNHVHWAFKDGGIVPNLYDNGGALPPGLSFVANRTGKPEQVLTDSQFESITNRGGDTTYAFDVGHMGADAREVARELDRMRRDRLAAAGLPTGGPL